MAVLPCRDVSTGVIDVTQLVGGGGGGAVSSVNGSGGGTGMTLAGGGVGAVTLTLGGDLNVSTGGTGQTALTLGSYLKGNGINPVTLQAVPIPIADGGTNLTTIPANNAVISVAGGAYTGDATKLYWDGVGFGVGQLGSAPIAPLDVTAGNTAAINGINIRAGSGLNEGALAFSSHDASTPYGTIYSTANTLGLAGPAGGTVSVTSQANFSSSLTLLGYLNTLFTGVTLANGLNSDISLPNSSAIRISGPAAAFSIGGFTNPQLGRILRIYNSTSQTMTVKNEDLSSTAVNRIKTLSGSDAVLAANSPSIVELIYEGTDQRWILDDIGASTGFIRADGTIPLTADWNAGLFNIKSKNSLIRFNIVTYGADPTGVADSTSAINAAITAAGTGGEVYIPPGTFNVTAAGTPIFLLTHPIHIRGDGFGSNIQVKTGTGAGVDIFTITPASTNDAVNYEFNDFRITAQSGTPGRHAIHVDLTSNSALLVEKLGIRRMYIAALGGRAIKLEANTPNTGGVFCVTIEDNILFGGINLANAGDSILITNNIITGANAAVDGTFVAGTAGFVIEKNNISSTGGLSFPAGITVGPRIVFNELELSAAFTGTNSSYIDLDGSGSVITSPVIYGNNISILAGGGTTNALRLNLVDHGLIDCNYISTNAGGTGIVTTASAAGISIGSGNKFTGAGAATSVVAGTVQFFWNSANGWLGVGGAATVAPLSAVVPWGGAGTNLSGMDLTGTNGISASKTGVTFGGGALGYMDFDQNSANGSRIAALNNIRLGINTAAAYSAATFAEAMRINSTGQVYINEGTASTTVAQVGGVIFTQTANSVTTANALTTIVGTGVGSATLPANLLIAGRRIRVRAGGFVSAATVAGTPTLTVLLGGVSVATGTGAAGTSTLNSSWFAETTITCRTTGAGGTVVGSGVFQAGSTGAAMVFAANTTTAAANTTGTLLVDVQLNNGAAAGTYTTTELSIEVLN